MQDFEPFETTARLRRQFAKVPFYERRDHEFRELYIANLRQRYSEIDATATGEASRQSGRRFRMLMRECNPIGELYAPGGRFVGVPQTPTRVEQVKRGEQNEIKVRYYEFIEGKFVSQWIFGLASFEYVRLDPEKRSTLSPVFPGLSAIETEHETIDIAGMTPGAIWKAYVEADTADELNRARAALREHLIQSYPDVRSYGPAEKPKAKWPDTEQALSIFTECNFILWPVDEVKMILGTPRVDRDDGIQYWYRAGSSQIIFDFGVTDGIVTKIALGGTD